MAEVMKCNLCPSEDRFTVPYDDPGVALMKGHLKDKHDVNARNLPRSVRVNYAGDKPEDPGCI